jgi:hypothetical protein
MKILLIVLLLIALPMALFAQQFYLGPTAMYKDNPQMLSTAVPESGDIAFGAEDRFTFFCLKRRPWLCTILNDPSLRF